MSDNTVYDVFSRMCPLRYQSTPLPQLCNGVDQCISEWTDFVIIFSYVSYSMQYMWLWIFLFILLAFYILRWCMLIYMCKANVEQVDCSIGLVMYL